MHIVHTRAVKYAKRVSADTNCTLLITTCSHLLQLHWLAALNMYIYGSIAVHARIYLHIYF